MNLGSLGGSEIGNNYDILLLLLFCLFWFLASIFCHFYSVVVSPLVFSSRHGSWLQLTVIKILVHNTYTCYHWLRMGPFWWLLFPFFIKYTTKTRWGEQEEGILEGEVRRPEKRNAAIHCKNELYLILKRECAPQMKKVMRMRKGVHYVWWQITRESIKSGIHQCWHSPVHQAKWCKKSLY